MPKAHFVANSNRMWRRHRLAQWLPLAIFFSPNFDVVEVKTCTQVHLNPMWTNRKGDPADLDLAERQSCCHLSLNSNKYISASNAAGDRSTIRHSTSISTFDSRIPIIRAADLHRNFAASSSI